MAEEENTEKKKKVSYGVLPRRLGGGPHNLGDPNDKSLRKVEKDVLIMEKVRQRTRKEKCLKEFQAFGECAKENGLAVVFNCREENSIMMACAERWFHDQDFVQECTNQYLEERSEYRRTGITRKQKEFANRMKS